MKIGILTYHRAENYGALLQAYGLRTYLLQQGFDVSFVDYWPEYHEKYFQIVSKRKLKKGSLKSRLRYLLQTLLWYIPKKRRKIRLQSFMKEQLGLPSKAKYTSGNDRCDEFDLVLYGSDQIWRKQKHSGHKGFDFWYFGSDNVIARKVAFAASMGVIETTPEEDRQLKPYFERFDSLAVREASLKEYLAQLGFNATVVLDPVFLLDKEDWRKLYATGKIASRPKGKYILYYNLLSNAESTAFANKLSRKTQLPVIEISKQFGVRLFKRRYNHTASVQTFLSLIDHAEYVVSNSFHGVAFSILFEKQFFAIGMGTKANRVRSLLSALDISDRYLDDKMIPQTAIDYNNVGNRLEVLRNDTVLFLQKLV